MIQQTSLLAYRSLDGSKINERQKQVLYALEEIAPATNKQIAVHLGWPINSVTPRVLELRTKYKVVEAFKGIDGGRKASFWKPKNAPKEYGDMD